MKLSIPDRWRLRQASTDHRLRGLPVLVLMPHGRCNCRCLMCDIWRANAHGRELTEADIAPHLDSMRKLRVRLVVLSGGEALMHSNLWRLCESLKSMGIKISLLSTGLLMKRHAVDIVRYCDDVIVSLDGAPSTHDRIRNIPRAFERLDEGVKAVQDVAEEFPITARCVIQKQNYHEVLEVIVTGQELGLKKVSFLAADVSSEAFNHPGGWSDDQAGIVALDEDESMQFARQIRDSEAELRAYHRSGFVAESWEKLASIAQYFLALHGKADFPVVRCNAPWTSAVVEADGEVRPCFFHRAYGNLADGVLRDTLNSDNAVAFRNSLDVSSNTICQRCVCSLNL